MTKVFGDFDQEKLDNEYLISRTVPDIEPFLADYARLSKKLECSSTCVKMLPTAEPRRKSSIFSRRVITHRCSFLSTAILAHAQP